MTSNPILDEIHATRDKPKRWLDRPAPVEVRDRQWSLVGGS